MLIQDHDADFFSWILSEKALNYEPTGGSPVGIMPLKQEFITKRPAPTPGKSFGGFHVLLRIENGHGRIATDADPRARASEKNFNTAYPK